MEKWNQIGNVISMANMHSTVLVQPTAGQRLKIHWPTSVACNIELCSPEKLIALINRKSQYLFVAFDRSTLRMSK
jgi:hypothetical protein